MRINVSVLADSLGFVFVLNWVRIFRLLTLSLALKRLGTLIAIVVLSRMLTLIDLIYRAFNRALRLLM